MSERIKELWMATDTEHHNPPALEWAEKFAELIVQECLSNMQNCNGDLDFAIWKTKKDFGIKNERTN